MGYTSLKECLLDLERKGHLVRVTEEVDPYLEMSEVQRRVYEVKGPAVYFENVKGCRFPAVCNLFGTIERCRFIFRGSLERGPFTTISAESTIRLWRGFDGCSDLPVVRSVPDTVDDGWSVRVDGYNQCPGAARVALYTIQGAPHVWPKGDMDPAMEIAEFFLGEEP